MMDLWVTLGTLLADPRLDDAIQAAGPDFKPLRVEVKWPDETTARVSQGSGEFLDPATAKVRDAINQFFYAKYPCFRCTASLYCAARICRLYKLQPFAATLKSTFAAIDAKRRPRLSKEYLAMVGLCIVDNNVRVEIASGNLTAGLAQQFYWSPTPEEDAALQDLVAALQSPSAAFDPLGGPMWDQGCEEVFYFYGKFGRTGV